MLAPLQHASHGPGEDAEAGIYGKEARKGKSARINPTGAVLRA
jgi:hypothetical protein